jgi:hypothetical protein
MRYELFEDNAGFFNLAILEGDECIYYLSSADKKLVLETRDEFLGGGDPVADYWEGGEDDPQECYNSICSFVEAGNGGATLLEDGEQRAQTQQPT